MIVIADTGPINYLVCIDEVAVLPMIYGVVIIPASVRNELSRDGAPEVVRHWIARPPEWLEVRTPALAPDAELIEADLDEGECDAILLAEELGATDLIVDNMQGRREAERRHIHFIGTIGVLQIAAKRGMLNLKTALTRLRATNFYIAQDLIDHLVAEADQ
jgi:predicted nucleic acid-binding protein